jgi:hypothetical protein
VALPRTRLAIGHAALGCCAHCTKAIDAEKNPTTSGEVREVFKAPAAVGRVKGGVNTALKVILSPSPKPTLIEIKVFHRECRSLDAYSAERHRLGLHAIFYRLLESEAGSSEDIFLDCASALISIMAIARGSPMLEPSSAYTMGADGRETHGALA